MTFADRAMLVALVALAIPLVIHLVGRRRPRHVELPTARFAAGVHHARRGRLLLKRAALLALRVAVVALLVLALAGPRISVSGGQADSVPWLICLDTSPSMWAADRGATRYERARAWLEAGLAALPDDAPVTLLESGDGPAGSTAAIARETLRGTPRAPWSDEPLGRMLNRALETLRTPAAAPRAAGGDPSHPHILIITDATPWALRDLGPGRFRGLAADVVLLPVGGAVPNVCLGLPAVAAAEKSEGRFLDVEAAVSAAEREPPGTVFAALDGGRPVSAAPAQGTGRVRLRCPLPGAGPWQGRVYVTEEDALASDNARFFTVAAPQPIRVLVVDAADEPDARVRSADLVAATFAGPEATAPKQAARLAAAKVDLAALARADVVFWVGSQGPPDLRPVEEFLARGGGAVWIPADASRLPDPALAAALGIRARGIEPAAEGVAIDPAAYTSDLLAAFEGGTGGDLGAPIFRRRLVLDDAGADAIRFRDGTPAIVSRHAGKGRRVALAAGPGPDWGDLAGRAEFVVLTHSLAESLAPGPGPRRSNLVLSTASPLPPDLEAAPGNHERPPAQDEAAGQANRTFRYSVNIEPDETADLVPQVDRLKAAFAADRVRVLDPSRESLASLWPAAPNTRDLTVWFVLALAAAVAAESLLAALQSHRPGAAGPGEEK